MESSAILLGRPEIKGNVQHAHFKCSSRCGDFLFAVRPVHGTDTVDCDSRTELDGRTDTCGNARKFSTVSARRGPCCSPIAASVGTAATFVRHGAANARIAAGGEMEERFGSRRSQPGCQFAVEGYAVEPAAAFEGCRRRS